MSAGGMNTREHTNHWACDTWTEPICSRIKSSTLDLLLVSEAITKDE